MQPADHPVGDEPGDELVQEPRRLEVRGRRPAAAQPVARRPLGAAELGPGRAEHHDPVAVAQRRCPGGGDVEPVDEPDHADDRRRVDVDAVRLVVEADVAADHRDAERAARVAHAVDRLRELPHHLGVLGVAEVEAVHERQRPGAAARDVARRLEHRELRADARVERAEPALAVDRQRERAAVGLLEPQHAGVAAGPGDGVEEQLVVVLAPHPALVRDVRRGEQVEQLGREVRARAGSA